MTPLNSTLPRDEPGIAVRQRSDGLRPGALFGRMLLLPTVLFGAVAMDIAAPEVGAGSETPAAARAGLNVRDVSGGDIAEGERLGPDLARGAAGQERVLEIEDGHRLVMKHIPAGRFTMGSPASEARRSNDEAQVEVEISGAFWLAETPVTQGQWEAVMGGNPSHFKGADLPVESVSWEDAQEFMKKLNEKKLVPEGWEWRLPSEAEWEYACRAGTRSRLNSGKELTSNEGECANLDEVGWYVENSGRRPRPVKGKTPNAWGLYDMHGNVWEWCMDAHQVDLPGGVDPVVEGGPGADRMFRGGSWDSLAADCRAAFRNGASPGRRHFDLGFRPALVPSR